MHEHHLALLCDAQGMIAQVLRNDLPLVEVTPGRLFPMLADQASRVKALHFLDAIRTQASAFDWELNLLLPNGPTSLHFSGGRLGEQLLIVGATSGATVHRLYEDMLRMNNEQTNLLRASLKESRSVAQPEPEASLYDEISRLNNELVGMQRELSKKNAELERLDHEKNRFLGMAAHDLRNPLHVILTYSGFLLEETPTTLGPQYREFLEIISTSSEFMGRLVDDLLDVARIEAGQLDLDLTATDLGALVARNVALNRTLATKKAIRIELHSAPVPLAIVDTAKIEQVLNNLITNAVKFSPTGSTVEVYVMPVYEGGQFSSLKKNGHCEESATKPSHDTNEMASQSLAMTDPSAIERHSPALCDGIQISVRDHGPGIAPEDQTGLFQPFRRGRAKGSAGEKSTGLGLMIVKRIVTGHGGRIWLESEVGTGTTFFVVLPLQPPEHIGC